MKKKWTLLIVILFVLALVGACGGSSGDDDDDNGTSTTVAISGTLSTGTITNIAGKFVTKQTEAAADYSVVVISNASNQTYRTTTDTSGAFSVDVPADGTYLVSVINDGSYIGPTVFSGSGDEANTAITPTSDTALGAMTVDADSGYAATDTAPDSVATDVTVVAEDGVPVGSGNDGKETQGDTTGSQSDSDMDVDGIPNIFDADEDDDGIRNGVTSTPSGATVESDYIETVMITSNIWADHNTTMAANDLIAMRLHVIPVSGQEDNISSVQCIDVPATIADVATIRWADSLGVPEANYPEENSLWSASSYNLYKATELADEQWVVSITPTTDMEVGDTFTVRVTYTDETYEDFFITTSYFLQDWSKILTYNGTSMPTEAADRTPGTNSSPITISSTSLEIVFSKPTDEDGTILEGLTYSVAYSESSCDPSPCAVPTSTTEETVTETEGVDTLTHTIPPEGETFTPGTTYYVTPISATAGSSSDQRNGEEVWFTITE